MKSKNVMAIFLVTIITISMLIVSMAPGAFAETYFTDGFETADYSNWDGTVNNTGSTMQVSSTDFFEGQYSAECSLSNTLGTYAYTYKNVSPGSTIFHREYIKVSSLPPAGARTDLFGVMDLIGTGHHLGTIAIQNEGGNYRWSLRYFDLGIHKLEYSSLMNIQPDTWYYIEIMVKVGAGTGQVTVWVAEDATTVNQAQPTINVLNLQNNQPIAAVFFGGYVTGASYPVNIYADSVIVSNEWIGPRDFTDPTIEPITANSHSVGAPVTLSSLITDNVGIDYVIPSWNNTGTWTNQTAINANNSPSFTATFTDTWNINPGTIVSVIFYANDTSNNWMASSQTDFALNNYEVTLTANQTSLIQEDTAQINISVTKNGIAFPNYLANITRDATPFLNNQANNFTDTEIQTAAHTYTIASLYDTALDESVTFTTNSINIAWAESQYVVTLSANQTALTQEDTIRVNLSVTKNGLPYTNYLANITRDNSLFLSNVVGTFDDTETSVTSHTYTTLALFDLSTQESVTFTTNTIDAEWAKSQYSVALSASQSSVARGTPVTITISVTKNGLPFNNYVANITKDGSLYTTNATGSIVEVDLQITMHTYTINGLIDRVTNEQVEFTTNTININWNQGTPSPTATPNPTTTPTTTPTPTTSPEPTSDPTNQPTNTPTQTPPPTEDTWTVPVIGLIIALIIAAAVVVVFVLRKRRIKP